jgi:hypothetical protein
VWLLASIPNQFHWRWWESIARRDALGLLPRWTFFAPRPGRHDLHILIRNWSAGTPGPWRELERPSPHPWLRAVWNPGRFARKAVTDKGNAVVRAVARRVGDSPSVIQLHPAYLEILVWALADTGGTTDAAADSASDAARQFALIRTQTDRPGRRLDVAFVSFVHPLK